MKTNCKFHECENFIFSKELCKGHYQQQYNGKELTPLGLRGRKKLYSHTKCEVNSCNRNAEAKGLCRRCYQRLWKFDISREELIKLPSRCEVCGSEDRTHLDHSHESNNVRGVLCHGCNIAIGMVKENKETLNNLIKYLEKHSE